MALRRGGEGKTAQMGDRGVAAQNFLSVLVHQRSLPEAAKWNESGSFFRMQGPIKNQSGRDPGTVC